MKLLTVPRAPKELPVTALIRNAHGIAEWKLFLCLTPGCGNYICLHCYTSSASQCLVFQIAEALLGSSSYGSRVLAVSAVLFSNSATLSKFNRMGKLAGFGSDRVHMTRIGFRHNFDPNAEEGTPFAAQVKPSEYTESWAEGMRLFINPRAVQPIPPQLFTGCAFHFLRDGRRVAMLPDFFVHTSRTLVLLAKD